MRAVGESGGIPQGLEASVRRRIRERGVHIEARESESGSGNLATVDEASRATLEELRRSILAVIPDAEQCISYGMPAFKVRGKTVAGFAAFKNHLSYLPHSGSVLATLADDVAGYETSKGALRFAVDKPLPKRLVKKLVTARMREAGLA